MPATDPFASSSSNPYPPAERLTRGGGDGLGQSDQRPRAIVTWALAVALILVAFVAQRPGAPDPTRVDRLVAGLEDQPVAPHERLLLKVALAGGGGGGGGGGGAGAAGTGTGTGTNAAVMTSPFSMVIQPMLDQAAGFEWPKQGIFGTPPSPDTPVTMPEVKHASGASRVRAALSAGALLGPKAALNRLELTAPTLDAGSDLVPEVEALRAHFQAMAAKEPERSPLAEGMGERAMVDELLDRHGLFAALALRDLSDRAAEMRSAAERDGHLIFLLLAMVSLAFLLVMLAGFILWIVALVGLSQGWMRFRFREWIRPDELQDEHRLLWVETLVVFLAMFVGLKFVIGALAAAGMDPSSLSTVALLGQWLVLPSIFWPLVRGVSWRKWQTHLGWSASPTSTEASPDLPGGVGAAQARGGVLREIGAGLLGYCAWLFAYVCVALVWILLYSLVSQALGMRPPGGLEENKLVDMFGSGSALDLLLLVLLASIWAPVVEETIFRGVLFRHWRPRCGFLISAAGTATIFAVLHGYAAVQLVLVGVLGVGFALIREWRGSIIGCVAAHGLHNFVVTVVMLTLFKFLA